MKKILLFLLIFIFSFSEEISNSFIKEAEYQVQMTTEVKPYLNQKKISGKFKGTKNKKLYYENFIIKNPKASIVLVHGFGESIEKFYELIYYFTQNGYSVYALEHRGHSHSDRFSKKSQIYIDDYNYYIDDLKLFIDNYVLPYSKKNYLFAHSMGGGIGTVFLERYPDYFEKAILSTPMLEINLGKAPKFIAKSYTKIGLLLDKGEELAPGETPFKSEYNLEKSSTSSKERYEYYYKKTLDNPYLQNGGASIKWLEESLALTEEATKVSNIKKIKTKTLLFQAGKDTYVKPKGQNKLAKYSDKVSIVYISNSKHEIYREVDSILHPYLYTVINFYNN